MSIRNFYFTAGLYGLYALIAIGGYKKWIRMMGRREMRRVDWDFVPEAVVVGNGEFPVSALPLRMLDTASFTVCCDGAADRYLASGRVPDRIVGDGDSLSVENQKRYAGIIRYNPDQETNDQTKAVNYLMEKGFRRIAIVGATGRQGRPYVWVTSVC